MILGFSDPAPLRGVGVLHGSHLDASLYFNASSEASDPAAERWRIVGYDYALLDRHRRELLAFHWHPTSALSPVSTPHLHVSARLTVPRPGADPESLPLDKRHLPTGHVSLPAVVRMLIAEFGVQPLIASRQERLTEAAAVIADRHAPAA